MQDYYLECPACGKVLNDGLNCSMWYQGTAFEQPQLPLDGTFSCVNCVKYFFACVDVGKFSKSKNPFGWRTMGTKRMLGYTKHEWEPLRERARQLAVRNNFAQPAVFAKDPAAAPATDPAAVPAKEPAAASGKEPAAAPVKDPAAVPAKEPAAAPFSCWFDTIYDPAAAPVKAAVGRPTLKVRIKTEFSPGLHTTRELLHRIPKSAVSAKDPAAAPATDPAAVPAKEPAAAPAKDPAAAPGKEPAAKRRRAPKRKTVPKRINPLTMGHVLRAATVVRAMTGNSVTVFKRKEDADRCAHSEKRASEEYVRAVKNATEATGAAARAFSDTADLRQITNSMETIGDALDALHQQQQALTVVLVKNIQRGYCNPTYSDDETNTRLGNCETMLKNVVQMLNTLLEGRRLTNGPRFKYTSFTNKDDSQPDPQPDPQQSS